MRTLLTRSTLIAALAAALLGSLAAEATTPAAGGKAKSKAKAKGGQAGAPGCPAANKVNTPAENNLGCPVVLPRSVGPQWEPATKADFVRQSGGRAFAEQKVAGTGGIRCVKFFKKKHGKTAKIYRIYGGGAREFGGYWTFDQFQPGDASYRRKFAVCKDWNDISQSVTCTLGPNTDVVIAVGPGQSVGPRQSRGNDGKVACTNVCADKNEKYPASRDLQVVLFGGDRFCNKP